MPYVIFESQVDTLEKIQEYLDAHAEYYPGHTEAARVMKSVINTVKQQKGV